MSFLNPVSEPVKRFSSTDAGAPQINYNARVAGDVKTVLKACLVTGYGDKASAGWSIANEVNHVAEFVSPSAAMSDYRLGIDDTSTSNTTWYYQYRDARTNPDYNNPTKSFSYIDKTHSSNGWELIISQRGFIFIECVQDVTLKVIFTRATYFGQVKSALLSASGSNIIFFNAGHNSTIPDPRSIYSKLYVHLRLGEDTEGSLFDGTTNSSSTQFSAYDVSVVDVISPIFIARNTTSIATIAKIPGIRSAMYARYADVHSVTIDTINARPVLKVALGLADSNEFKAMLSAKPMCIDTDYWEY